MISSRLKRARGGHQRQSTPLRTALSRMFPAALFRRLATSTGAVRRRRRVNLVSFFWVLVLTLGRAEGRTLADLRRSYERVTGGRLSASSFYVSVRSTALPVRRRGVTPLQCFSEMRNLPPTGQTSLTRYVPAGVPSLAHSSMPCTPSSASKNKPPPALMA